ncbi:MAG TPA: TlpA disulfide reductase family protein [Candidatus Polarisedimenticolia bacterium]|jgi:thiol-disulfide isomerase/thioredoxin|nr:TlpA disulfide reductase family protein [Candidatus Polarisedimenticolia bacterium]
MNLPRRSQSNFLALVALVAALGSFRCSGGATAPASPASSSSKEIRLNFSLPTPGGAPVDLKKFDGSIRVVDFWATWCPPCREAIPSLNALHRKYKEQGVNILGVSVDENPKVLAAFDQEVHIEYTSLMSSRDAEEAFGGVAGLPTTFVLDRQGRVFQSYVGPVDRETLEGDIRSLLAAR